MREEAFVTVGTLNTHATPGGIINGDVKRGDRLRMIRQEGPPRHKKTWFYVRDKEGRLFWVDSEFVRVEADQYVPPQPPPVETVREVETPSSRGWLIAAVCVVVAVIAALFLWR
jgi:hypothetical protein